MYKPDNFSLLILQFQINDGLIWNVPALHVQVSHSQLKLGNIESKQRMIQIDHNMNQFLEAGQLFRVQ